MSIDNLVFLGITGAIFIYILQALIRSLRLVPARVEFIVERFGRYHKTLEAGFHFLIPFVDRVAYTKDLKEHTMDVPPQTCFTKDEIQVEVDGVIYLQVFDSQKASYGITDYQYAAIQLAQTTTRAIIGTLELDRTFEEREAISGKVVSVLDHAAMKWGVRILRFEIKNLVPPESVRQSMEKQVTAERNRRAILEKSVGQKQSLINTSEGQMRELINNSEGEMQKRINEASGKASEILSLGEATAESIKKIAEAINRPGGKAAVNLELGQKYIKSLAKFRSNSNKVIMGGNLGDMKEMLKGIDINV
jgi:regulator of protease activity HflC (stomatin/prohibitin superfamily)